MITQIEQCKEIVEHPTIRQIVEFIMRIIGSYGVIQVFAQDIGVSTGCKQAKFTQNILVQIFMFTCSAYAVTDDFIQSFVGTLIYFIMKYIYSKNKTHAVCFPNEEEIKKC